MSDMLKFAFVENPFHSKKVPFFLNFAPPVKKISGASEDKIDDLLIKQPSVRKLILLFCFKEIFCSIC